MEGINNSEYNPKLGETNRYANARHTNKELAENINKEALNKVNRATRILDKIEANPKMFNLSDPDGGSKGKWMGQYLMEFEREELYPLYGAGQVIYEENIPSEIISFLKRVENLRNKVNRDPSIINM